MNAPARQQQWDAIVGMTRQMLTHAQKAEWDELVDLYDQRDGLIHSFFSRPVPENEAAFLHQAIPELMEQDKALMALCATARDEAAQQLGSVNLGRKAEAAYNQNR